MVKRKSSRARASAPPSRVVSKVTSRGNFFTKSTLFKPLPNYATLAGGSAIVVGGLYYAQEQGWIPPVLPDLGSLFGTGDFTLANSILAPGTPLQVTGKYNKGTVYYTIVRDDGVKVSQGVLGQGAINTAISTAGFQNRNHNLILSDTPEATTSPVATTGPTNSVDPNLVAPSITRDVDTPGVGPAQQGIQSLAFTKLGEVITIA